MKTKALEALSLAKSIQRDAPINYVPPSEGTKPQNQHVIPHAMAIKGSANLIYALYGKNDLFIIF